MKTKLLTAFLLFYVTVSSIAQHNIYIKENDRIRIVNNATKMSFNKDTTKVWSDANTYSFNTSSVNLVSLSEKDSWRSKVMPERYLSDFDYDISFLDTDKEMVLAEVEITDEKDKLYNDFVNHSIWTKTVYINYDDNTVSITGDTDSLTINTDGAHVIINTGATGIKYILSGSSNNGCFKIYSEKKAYLILNGVILSNADGPVINSQHKKHLFIELPDNTVNILTDAKKYVKVDGEDQRGCIFAEGEVCISGAGQLYVNSNKKCGIASDDYVHILDGFVHVSAHGTKAKAVYAKDNIIIGGGVLRTYVDGVASKGITSDSLVTVTGGVIKSITTGDAIWDEDEQDYSSCCALKSDWDMNITGGKIYCLSTGTGGKGISAGNAVTTTNESGKTKTTYNGKLVISDADIYVRTSGKRIPEVKSENSHGQKEEAAASPKGIKSTDKMTINSGNVYVRCSGGATAEGIESKRSISINGGKIRSYCVDDGMNAEGCDIKGGDIFICSTENDGFDVSYLYMYDGLLYTIGGDVDQMGLDTDGKTFKVMGGEIVALGARNCIPNSSSTQANVLCYLKKNVSYVALADTDDNNIIKTIPTPDSYNTICILFSNSDIKVGNKYKILSYEKSLHDTPVTEYDFTTEGISITLGSFK